MADAERKVITKSCLLSIATELATLQEALRNHARKLDTLVADEKVTHRWLLGIVLGMGGTTLLLLIAIIGYLLTHDVNLVQPLVR